MGTEARVAGRTCAPGNAALQRRQSASKPVIESGRVSDAAIAALVGDSGTVDETLRTKVVDAILALPSWF